MLMSFLCSQKWLRTVLCIAARASASCFARESAPVTDEGLFQRTIGHSKMNHYDVKGITSFKLRIRFAGREYGLSTRLS